MSKRYIEEGDPIETKVTPAQPAFTSTGMQISLQGDIFDGLRFEASQIVDDTSDERWINEQLDRMRRIYERQRTIVEHRMTRFDLANKVTTLKALPETIKEYTADRAATRNREVASWQIRHQMRGARGDFKPNDSQRSWLDNFDVETQKKLLEYDTMLKDWPAEIKNLQDRVARCRRVIDDLVEKTDLIDDLLPEVDEAAE